MNTLLQLSLGQSINQFITLAAGLITLAINLTIGVVVLLLIARWIIDAAGINPFNRLVNALRKPTNEMIYRARSSQFYLPLKRAFNFDPAFIMILIALAILWFVVNGVFSRFFTVLQGLGLSLDAFAGGSPLLGTRYLIGTALLAAIFFLLTLMTLVFINWLFGFFARSSFWALNRIGPLLRIFEFGGVFAGWSFVILWLVLSLAAGAVQAIFF